MAKTYRVNISDTDWKILEWKFVDPNKHIDDLVTGRVNVAIKELAEAEIKRRLIDPNWDSPIPADYRQVLEGMVIKSANQMMQETAAYQEELIKNPDIANSAASPSSFFPKT